jgi:hypothetical protein
MVLVGRENSLDCNPWAVGSNPTFTLHINLQIIDTEYLVFFSSITTTKGGIITTKGGSYV